MFGFGLDEEAGGLRVQPALRPETTALVARMAAPPTASRARLIDALVSALVAAGIWDRLDMLMVAAAHHPQAALLNWRGVAFSPAIGGGSPVFVPDRGFYCDGLDDWIDTGFAPPLKLSSIERTTTSNPSSRARSAISSAMSRAVPLGERISQ